MTFQGKPKIQGLFKDCGNPVIETVSILYDQITLQLYHSNGIVGLLHALLFPIESEVLIQSLFCMIRW